MTLLLQGAGLQTISAGSGDPIGDALRADAVAYWTMDEASGTRVDATGHGHNLSVVNTVNGVTGKVGNAANLTDAQINALKTSDDTAFRSFGVTTLSVCCWAKIDSFLPAGADHTIIFKFGDNYTSFDGIDYYAYFNTSTVRFDVYNAWGDEIGYIAHSQAITEGQYFFLVVSIDASSGSVIISLNGNAESDTFFGDVFAPEVFTSGQFSAGGEYAGSPPPATHIQGDIDEVGFWNRLLTQDEVNYLYNSGAGRALFPAP